MMASAEQRRTLRLLARGFEVVELAVSVRGGSATAVAETVRAGNAADAIRPHADHRRRPQNAGWIKKALREASPSYLRLDLISASGIRLGTSS
jgi:hypothetical protein